jgi:hypothetical protein
MRDQLNRWGRTGLVCAAVAGSSVVIAAVGTSPASAARELFRFTPASVNFGNIPGGATSKHWVTIKNISGSPQLMSGAGGGVAAPFGGSQSCEGLTLQPNKSCKTDYTFAPTASGFASADSTGKWNGQTFNISLSGTGVNSLEISRTTVAFGNLEVGKTKEVGVRITNESTYPVTMSGSGGGTESTVFSSSQDCEDLVLTHGKYCRMFFRFTPAKTGPAELSVDGAWNFASYTIKLTGTGT